MDVFERCLQLDKPFALLMSNFWLNSVGPCRLFKDRELQLLMFDKRIQYDKGGGVPFGSSYYCHRLLPKQIVFEELAVCRNDYSRMHRDMDHLNRILRKETLCFPSALFESTNGKMDYGKKLFFYCSFDFRFFRPCRKSAFHD